MLIPNVVMNRPSAKRSGRRGFVAEAGCDFSPSAGFRLAAVVTVRFRAAFAWSDFFCVSGVDEFVVMVVDPSPKSVSVLFTDPKLETNHRGGT